MPLSDLQNLKGNTPYAEKVIEVRMLSALILPKPPGAYPSLPTAV